MSSLAEMRDELRELRKSHPEHKPVSKMRKADISSMIQKLKVHREETPAVVATPAAAPKAMKAPKPVKTKSEPAPKAKMMKNVMVSERADTAAKKPKGKKAQE